MAVLNIQPAKEDSILPTYSQETGYVLYANDDVQMAANRVACIKTGFRLSIPSNYCALNVRHKDLTMLGGLIDSDFRGEVAAICMAPDDRLIKRGDPVARMLVLEIAIPEIEDGSTPLNYESSEPAM